MSESIFISRALNSDSLFHNFVDKGYKVYHESLVVIKPMPFSVPISDWFFFYSKNGIKFFFENVKYNKKSKHGVLSQSSAEYFKQVTGQNADYIGKSSSEQIASDLINLVGKQTFSFIKAKNSISSVEKALEKEQNNLEIKSIAVYDNTIKKDISSPRCSHICLTSPMNSKAWFDKHPYDGEQIYAIGPTTAKHIRSIIGVTVPYCKTPSEESLYNMVNQELEQSC